MADPTNETLTSTHELDADPVDRFDALFHALTTSEAEGNLPKGFSVKSLDESDLRKRICIAPDGVTIFETGDDTLKSKSIITVDLPTLTSATDPTLDSSFEATMLDAAEKLDLEPELLREVRDLISSRQRDIKSRDRFFAKQAETGYSRYNYKEWGDPSVTIVKTEKKDGTVLMGAILGAITTTHVSLGGDHVGGPYKSGLYDPDDLGVEGMPGNRNVKIGRDTALAWAEQTTLDNMSPSEV